jgi:HEAT repeat protein
LATNDLAAAAQRRFSKWMVAAVLIAANAATTAQVAPLAPRWLAGTPPPPVETFAAGLERHQIALTESALIAALRDPDGEVRSLAAAQLAAMDDHAALKHIVRAFQDERDPQVQVNIAGASTWLGSRLGLEQLQRMCADFNVPSTARLDAARYVSNKSLPTCFSAVQEIAQKEQDPSIRVLAIAAAVSYGGKPDRAQAVAVSALSDVDPSVRTAAADALLFLRATSAIGALNRALQTEGDLTAREHLREAIRVLQLSRTGR